MAELVKNDKGFKVVKLSKEEASQLGWGIDPHGHCLCMRCNKVIEGDIYYPVVLNDTMDKECYEKWYNSATYYEDDRDYENKMFNVIMNSLSIDE